MATADVVVVEFEAKVDGYKRDVTSAADTYSKSMDRIQAASLKAEGALDGLASAQAKHTTEVAKYRAQLDAGEISQKQFNAEVLKSKQAVDAAGTAYRNAQKDLARLTLGNGHAVENTRISQQILQHVARSTADSFAAGTPLMMIFSTHLGQLAEAGAYAGGSLGKVGTFLAGPWGIAATVAASVLLPLIANLFKTGDTVDDLVAKLKEHFEKTQAGARAQTIFAQTLEGSTQAAEENRKAVEALNLVHETAAEAALRVAEATRQSTIATERDTLKKLENAKATLAQISANGLVGNIDAPEAALIQAQDKVKKIEADLKQVQASLATDEKSVIGARASVIVEQATATREQQINRLYDKRIDDAKALAVQQNKVGEALERQVKAIDAAREAELKRYHDSQRAGSHFSNEQSGRDLDAASAASIARAAGLRVNSSTRTYAQQSALYNAWVAAGKPASNPVARPGTSAHEGANGRWALDIQLADGVTPALLRQVFGAKGVTLTKVLKEQGHYHIEGKQSQEAADAEKAADAAQKKAEQEDKQYNTALARLSLERTLQDLRSTGDVLDAEIADQMQSNFEIESQFPQKANETNEAYRERLKLLKDIANATIASSYAGKGSLVTGPTTAQLGKQIAQDVEAGAKAQKEADDALQQHREEQIRTLAALYEDAFRGGTHAIWKDFKSIGLRIVAEVLAKFTIAKLAGGGGSFDFGSAITSALGMALPGFASGGSMTLGGRGGVDRNMLSLNGQPIARVSSGETLNIGNPSLMRGGTPAIINQTFVLDARHGITTPELLQYVNQTARGAAAQMGATVTRGVLQAMPNRMASFTRDGT